MPKDPDIEAAESRVEGHTYFTQRYAGNAPEDIRQPPQAMRTAARVIDQARHLEYVQIGEAVVLHSTPGGRQQILAMFAEDSRGVRRLIIQRFTASSGSPTKQSFSFDASEAQQVLALISQIAAVALPAGTLDRVDDSTLEAVLQDPETLSRLYELGGDERLAEILRSDVNARDVVAVGRRRRQLEIFEQMLTDGTYFATASSDAGGGERAWQRFFEDNQWIFGYGLTHIFLEAWDPQKLEQTVSGTTVSGPGKRVDALLKTSGFIQSLCFVEIKIHTTPLLQPDANRPGVWAPSRDAVEGIAQLQRTVDEAGAHIRRSLELRDSDGNLTGDRSHYIQPRSFLVIGSLQQLTGGTADTVNEDKYRSFELLRRNTSNPEIVTFDELLARARFIVDSSS